MNIIKSSLAIARSIKDKHFKTKKIMNLISFEKNCPHSYNLQRKLALLVSNIDNIDKKDLRYVECKKQRMGQPNDLFTSFRIDFHNKDDLEKFKKKIQILFVINS